MATWVVCTQCGKIQEIAADGQIPAGWRRLDNALWCQRCTDANEDEAIGDVIDEEVLLATSTADPPFEGWNEGYCEVCKGPCRGH